MRAPLWIGTLVLMAACAEQTTYQDPPPTGTAVGAAPSQAYPCKRSDFPDGPAGDAAYTNCIIES